MAATKQDYLKAMGIEVWLLRPDTGVATSEEKPENLREEKVLAVPDAVVADKSDTGARPQFSLAFLHYETVGFCLSLQGDSAELPRRFCDDLARSLGGNVDAARYHKLVWPMVRSSGFDQSLDAAKEVVAEKFSTMPRSIVVFGEDLNEYYEPLKDQQIGAESEVDGRTCVLFESVDRVMSSADQQRNLWRILSSWRNA